MIPINRQLLLRVRASMSPQERFSASTKIMKNLLCYLAPTRSDSITAAYYPFTQEPNILALLHYIQKNWQTTICLPFITQRHHSLKFSIWEPKSLLTKGIYNIPTATGKDIIPNRLIVPMLGYHPLGYRVGYGGGYYDRTLHELRSQYSIEAIGICFHTLLLPNNYQPQPHDEPMDCIITEEAIYRSAK